MKNLLIIETTHTLYVIKDMGSTKCHRRSDATTVHQNCTIKYLLKFCSVQTTKV